MLLKLLGMDELGKMDKRQVSHVAHRQTLTTDHLWPQLVYQVLNIGMIVSSALMIWNGLKVVTNSESPIVVVLRYTTSTATPFQITTNAVRLAVEVWNRRSTGETSSSLPITEKSRSESETSWSSRSRAGTYLLSIEFSIYTKSNAKYVGSVY